MAEHPQDREIRRAAFQWLSAVCPRPEDVVSRQTLSRGFEFQGERIKLVGPQGIFKPRQMTWQPLTITTSPNSPYDDSFAPGELLRYCYRGVDPDHHENRRLRDAFRDQTPLIYLIGLETGIYLPVWPIFIKHDDKDKRQFLVEVEQRTYLTAWSDEVAETLPSSPEIRGYVTRATRQRIHQQAFRERVLRAYRTMCALCRLRHRDLLDAAHIVPDSEPEGAPETRNGLALCKIHHAAFDRMFIGIRPDFAVEVRQDILDEEDGPMLQHGLKGLHGTRIILPAKRGDRPDPGLLENRFERFRDTSR